MSRPLTAPRWGWIANQIEVAFGVPQSAVYELLSSEEGYSRFQALCMGMTMLGLALIGRF